MSSLILAALLAFFAVTVLTPFLISGLKHYKLTQPIRQELPPDHQLKRGTPLMAGLILLLGGFLSAFFRPSPLTYFLTTAFVLFSFIGFLDDFWKASQQDPGGISGKTKLLLQFAFSGLLLAFLASYSILDPVIPVFKNISVSFHPYLYFGLMLFLIVGSANAINFTDGLDGLLSITAIPTYFFFFAITESPDIRIFCLLMVACLSGFLLYNLHPAKAFMGDTGSLAIGGSLCFLAVIEKVEILVPLLFVVYFAEQLSVILQVLAYKLTGNRIFRMSPIHYHFSIKYGFSENKIVLLFGLASWLAAVVCYVYWRLFLKGYTL